MVDPLTLAVAALCVLIISFTKGAFGGGFAIRSPQLRRGADLPQDDARLSSRIAPLPAKQKCVQGLVPPWRREAFRRSIQWIGRNCARPQPIVATVSQHPGRKSPLNTTAVRLAPRR